MVNVSGRCHIATRAPGCTLEIRFCPGKEACLPHPLLSFFFHPARPQYGRWTTLLRKSQSLFLIYKSSFLSFPFQQSVLSPRLHCQFGLLTSCLHSPHACRYPTIRPCQPQSPCTWAPARQYVYWHVVVRKLHPTQIFRCHVVWRVSSSQR